MISAWLNKYHFSLYAKFPCVFFSVSFFLELAVPVVSLSNKTIFEAQTNKTVLHCAITSGYPAPNITWYKDGEQLNLLALGSKDDCRINGFHYMEKYRPPKAEYLVICRPSHVQNTGLYKCEAMNVVGNGSNEGYLNVLGLYRKLLQHF